MASGARYGRTPPRSGEVLALLALVHTPGKVGTAFDKALGVAVSVVVTSLEVVAEERDCEVLLRATGSALKIIR
jgi:hypothetical protein